MGVYTWGSFKAHDQLIIIKVEGKQSMKQGLISLRDSPSTIADTVAAMQSVSNMKQAQLCLPKQFGIIDNTKLYSQYTKGQIQLGSKKDLL